MRIQPSNCPKCGGDPSHIEEQNLQHTELKVAEDGTLSLGDAIATFDTEAVTNKDGQVRVNCEECGEWWSADTIKKEPSRFKTAHQQRRYDRYLDIKNNILNRHVLTELASIPGTTWKHWVCAKLNDDGKPNPTWMFDIAAGPRTIMITGDLGTMVLHPNTKNWEASVEWIRGIFGDDGIVSEVYLLSKESPAPLRVLCKHLVSDYLESDHFEMSYCEKEEELGDQLKNCETMDEFLKVWVGAGRIDDMPTVEDISSRALCRIECLRWFAEHYEEAVGQGIPALRDAETHEKKVSITWTEQHTAIVIVDNDYNEFEPGDALGGLVGSVETQQQGTFQCIVSVDDVSEV